MRWIALMALLTILVDALVAFTMAFWTIGIVLSVIFSVGIVVWGVQLQKSKRRMTHNEGWEIGKGIEITNPDRPINTKVCIYDALLNKGVLAYGTTGAGKTLTLLIGLFSYFKKTHPDWGWLIGDGKGDKDVYQNFIASGMQPDYFFSSECTHSDTFNLLGVKDPEQAAEVACAILLSADEVGGSKFYTEAQEAKVRELVPILKEIECKEGKAVTLRDVLAFFMDGFSASQVLSKAVGYRIRPVAVAGLYEWLAKGEKRHEEMKGLVNRLKNLCIGKLSDRWNDPEPTIDLERAIAEGKKIYMHLPYSLIARKIAIALTEILRQIATKRQLGGGSKQTMFPTLWEDWGGFIYESWGSYIARSRTARLPASFSFQSVDQTDKADITEQLDDLIHTKIIMNVEGEGSAVQCSKMFGTYETIATSVSDRTGKALDGTSTQIIERRRVTENDLWNLNKGEAYIITRYEDETGGVDKRFYRARFPLVELQQNPKDIDWPVIQKELGEGMGLWDELEERLGRQLLADALALGADTQQDSEETEQPAQQSRSEKSRKQKPPRKKTGAEDNLDVILDDGIPF